LTSRIRIWLLPATRNLLLKKNLLSSVLSLLNDLLHIFEDWYKCTNGAILKANEEKRKSRIRIRIREPVVQVGDPEHCLESVKILAVSKS
jgi:hypothetical protein